MCAAKTEAARPEYQSNYEQQLLASYAELIKSGISEHATKIRIKFLMEARKGVRVMRVRNGGPVGRAPIRTDVRKRQGSPLAVTKAVLYAKRVVCQ